MHFMAVFVALVIMASAHAKWEPPAEMVDFLATLHNKCVAKLNLPDDISKNYDFSNKSPEIMCYMKCIMVEGQWAGEDEIPYYDSMLERAHPDIKPVITNIVQKCRDVSLGDKECEKTYNFFSCVYNADPEHFYMP